MASDGIDDLPTIDSDNGPIEVGAVMLFDGNGDPVDLSSLGAATPATPNTGTVASSTGVGATTAGALSVAIANAGAADATVAGVTLPAGASVCWESANGLNPIAYDGTGTTLLITEVI